MGADHSLKKQQGDTNSDGDLSRPSTVDDDGHSRKRPKLRNSRIHSAGICYLTFTLTKLNKIYYTVTPDLSEVNKDKYEEKVQELANELDKEVSKIGTVKLLMKLT